MLKDESVRELGEFCVSDFTDRFLLGRESLLLIVALERVLESVRGVGGAGGT